MTICRGILTAVILLGFVTAVQAQSGARTSLDGRVTFVQKDVGNERWAITHDPCAATATGNVFFTDGRNPAFVWCSIVGQSATDFNLSCFGADACPFAPCNPADWANLGAVTLPKTFMAPPGGQPLTSLDCAREWGTCTWETVGAMESHNDLGNWCPDGRFLTQFDLDAFGSASAHDSPIVGQARCCALRGAEDRAWSTCGWATVGAVNSHNQLSQWCPAGQFLTQVDLDADGALSVHDSPIVGRGRCCSIAGAESNGWGSCVWVQVGAVESHNVILPWCPDGSFLTQFDLDGDASLSGHDSPIVGHARCCVLGSP